MRVMSEHNCYNQLLSCYIVKLVSGVSPTVKHV